MAKKVSKKEKQRLDEIREKVRKEFPPSKKPRLKFAKTGVGAEIRQAREAQGLTWYAVAKQAGIPHASTVRDIECGRDAKLSNIEAIAEALDLRVALVTRV